MATTTPNNGWAVPSSTDYVSQGAVAIETLGDAIDASVGTGLLAWTSWAPTLGGGWLNGNGTWTAHYAKIGKIVHVRGTFTVGSTTTKGTGLSITVPVTATSNAVNAFTPVPLGYANAGGSNTNLLFGYLNNTTSFTLFALGTAGTYANRANITSTVPATWATGDQITFAFTYEAA